MDAALVAAQHGCCVGNVSQSTQFPTLGLVKGILCDERANMQLPLMQLPPNTRFFTKILR